MRDSQRIACLLGSIKVTVQPYSRVLSLPRAFLEQTHANLTFSGISNFSSAIGLGECMSSDYMKADFLHNRALKKLGESNLCVNILRLQYSTSACLAIDSAKPSMFASFKIMY